MISSALPQEDLRQYLSKLEKGSNILHVKKPVDPRFEVAAVTKKVMSLGKTVVFDDVKGYRMRIVGSVLPTMESIARLFHLTSAKLPEEFDRRVSKPIPPRTVDSAPVKEVILEGSKCDSRLLPICTHYGEDAGPYITAGIVIAKDPETGFVNTSFNRMQFKGNKFGIRMMPPQHLGVIQQKTEMKSRNLKVAIAIGNHPYEMIASASFLPFGKDHFELAGALRGEPLEVVQCETSEVKVPAHCEIILEGEVLAKVREEEGPYGDFMHYYIPVMENHVFKLDCITHRKRPLYQVMLAGESEDIAILSISREAVIYRAAKKAGVEPKAVSLLPSGYLFIAAISIRKKSESDPKKIIEAAFGNYDWLKICIVVDDDVNVYDLTDLCWAVSTRCNIQAGVLKLEGKGFPRDELGLHQSKLGIDATVPLGTRSEFRRKVIPGYDKLDLFEHIGRNPNP